MASDKNGFFAEMRAKCPNMLDIDKDVCHHVHNCVKKFCSFFNNTVEKLLDDLHTDFDYGTDLGTYLEEICMLLGHQYVKPKERVPHRWLSVLDCLLEFQTMQVPLTVFYYSWLNTMDKMFS